MGQVSGGDCRRGRQRGELVALGPQREPAEFVVIGRTSAVGDGSLGEAVAVLEVIKQLGIGNFFVRAYCADVQCAAPPPRATAAQLLEK